jgi:hypothetical protein
MVAVIDVAEELPTVSASPPSVNPATPVLFSPNKLEPETLRVLVVKSMVTFSIIGAISILLDSLQPNPIELYHRSVVCVAGWR